GGLRGGQSGRDAALEFGARGRAHQSSEDAEAPDVWPGAPRSPEPPLPAGPARQASTRPTPAGATGRPRPGSGGVVAVPDRGGGRGTGQAHLDYPLKTWTR